MSNIRINKELRATEKNLSKFYSKISKILIFLTIILLIWFFALLVGVYIWGYNSNWALLSLNHWIILLSGLIGFFILLNVVLYYHFKSVDKKRIENEKPKPEFIKGRRVNEYTYPQGSEGGIFSKTYIAIDEHNVLRLRILMIKPAELWGKEKD